MLDDILAARVMVKGGMARAPPGDAPLRRALNARQFGLKLLANVTYGYTAAGFSGRMPCAELADAIVQSGRATLEAAMALVERPGAPWAPARVVYGDTDSLFISFPGRSPAAAWDAAAAIAAAVTAANPPPVALKLEKVYDGCALLAKKRYAGLAHMGRPPEAWVPAGLPPPALPAFDAKGIETVRRDTCPAVAKVLEATLRLLLGRRDLSEVRAAVTAACGRLLAGRVGLADLVFAKEVRLGTYRGALPPPAALVAARAVAADPRAAPRLGERVPYVVVCGPPGARLADLVVSPAALVEASGVGAGGGAGGGAYPSARLRPNGAYYVAKCVLPALDRVLALVGADCRAWVGAMPRPPGPPAPHKRVVVGRGGGGGGGGPAAGGGGPSTIAAFCLSRHCASCDGLTRPDSALCAGCAARPQAAAAAMAARLACLDRRVAALRSLCLACGGGGGGAAAGGIACTSLDCGAYFERRKAGVELEAAAGLAAAGLAELDRF
jgi:DNA polymerase zeta